MRAVGRLGGTGPYVHDVVDLLALGALALNAPVAVFALPDPGGECAVVTHGVRKSRDFADPALLGLFPPGPSPVEVSDLKAALPGSPLVDAPLSLRWAYGLSLAGPADAPAIVAVFDRWKRRARDLDGRAVAALVRRFNSLVPLQARAGEAAGAAAAVGGGGPAGPYRLLGSAEVARLFSVTERTVTNWALAGKLSSIRTVGGHRRYRSDEVMRLLAEINASHR